MQGQVETAISTKEEGLRERKKRETMQRIADTGLKLFVKNGYEGTTLDEIAAEAGIARRTFFYYFKSKEAILLAYMDGGGFAKALRATLLRQSTDQTPLAAVCNALMELLSSQQTEAAHVVDGLLQSNEALRARMQASYLETEQTVFETLCEMWPEASPASLRIAVMISVGAMRVAKEAWRRDGRERPLAGYLRESFGTLEELVGPL